MRLIAILSLMLVLSVCTGQHRDATYLTQVAKSVAASAASGDSAGLRLHVESVDALNRLIATQRREPALLTAIADSARLTRTFEYTPDSIYSHFRVPYGGRDEELHVGFTRRDGRWRIYYLTLASRM